MSRLFGTDGIRGVAFEPPLDRSTVARLGSALAYHLRGRGLPDRVLLAGDTRASTPVLAAWLAQAFAASGGEVVWAGVLPTPAVSHLLRQGNGFGAGVVVSASHNPAADNGIKLVSASGAKWPVNEEMRLEGDLAATPVPEVSGWLPREAEELRPRYLEVLAQELVGQPLAGMRLLVDAAQGAASPVAAAFFSRLGADVEVLNASPDGLNINAACGALHPEGLARAVVQRGADAGVAFDGDADRAVLVTHTGRVLNGDDLLYIWGRHLDVAGMLPGRAVVATVMSNLGLEVALARRGIKLLRCAVGDREVWETMQREGVALGGEQSGHIICAHHAVTGDGLLTAAHVLAIARAQQLTLEEMADLTHFPQVLLNVRVSRRRPLNEVPELDGAIARAHAALGELGRVLVRFSGTEPLLRIMVEAATDELAHTTAEQLAEVARRQLG